MRSNVFEKRCSTCRPRNGTVTWLSNVNVDDALASFVFRYFINCACCVSATFSFFEELFIARSVHMQRSWNKHMHDGKKGSKGGNVDGITEAWHKTKQCTVPETEKLKGEEYHTLIKGKKSFPKNMNIRWAKTIMWGRRFLHFLKTLHYWYMKSVVSHNTMHFFVYNDIGHTVHFPFPRKSEPVTGSCYITFPKNCRVKKSLVSLWWNVDLKKGRRLFPADFFCCSRRPARCTSSGTIPASNLPLRFFITEYGSQESFPLTDVLPFQFFPVYFVNLRRVFQIK